MKCLQIPNKWTEHYSIPFSRSIHSALFEERTKRKMHFDQINPHQKLENKPSTESTEKRSWGIKTTKNNYGKTAGKGEKRWPMLKDGSYCEWRLLPFPMISEPGGMRPGGLGSAGFWAGCSGSVTAALRCPLVYDNGFEESIAIWKGRF